MGLTGFDEPTSLGDGGTIRQTITAPKTTDIGALGLIHVAEVNAMDDPAALDQVFNVIMRRMVETGQAPHYTELARELALSMEDARKALHALFESGIPGWLFPSTSLITSFAPFNNLPTQYKITVDGHQKWFGQ